MEAISLFAGVGGFELGFERAGIETILQAEQDEKCQHVLERHWPEVERVTDVRDITTGTADLIYGGFPCQDVSVAGRREGLGGERSSLWAEFARIAGTIRPRWCVIETVPGILTTSGGRDFGRILHDLDELGYGVAWATLDAQFFGVPQQRRRIFIVASDHGPGPAAVLALADRGGVHLAASGTQRERSPLALEAGARNARTDGGSPWDGAYVTTTLQPVGGGADDNDAQGGHLIVGTGVRRLMPVESERLMGWPDDWTRWDVHGNEIADSHRYRMCGNGVVAPVAEWIGHRLVRVDKLLA